jgi:crossover junction endodeoxyribonuclease RuvC
MSTPSTVRILGIDPGLQTTGFGVLDMTGSRLQYVASGVIQTTKEEMGNLPARLKVIYDGIREIQERYQPDVASVEIVFVNVNPQATLLLGQARGCCVTALGSCGLPVAEYTALQMKQSVTGHGRAAKSQVQHIVKPPIKLPVVARQDAGDAQGLANTHAHASPSMNKLAAQGVLSRKTHGMFRSGRSH